MRGKMLSALALLAATPALAYMLPGWSLIRKTETKREESSLHSLLVSGTLTFVGADADAVAKGLGVSAGRDGLDVPATFSYRMPGRCRVDASPEGKAALTAQYRDQRVTSSPTLESVASLLRLSCPLLSAPGGEESTHAVVEWMKSLGVDFQTTSLARFGGTIAEVVGAEPRDLNQPQVWIDENELNPLRVIGPVDKAMMDVHLLDPGPVGGDWHPRALELWTLPSANTPAQLRVRFTVEKVEPNAKVPEI